MRDASAPLSMTFLFELNNNRLHSKRCPGEGHPAALTPDGLGALLSINGAGSSAYLNQVFGPTLRPGDVVVLDNLSVHQMEGLNKIVKAYGVRLLYLPSYSPDFNLIELAFGKRKTGPRIRTSATCSRTPFEPLPRG